MIWKPKERELTAEEAIELARKELAPFWFNSPPLVAGIQHGGKATAHPLDPSFMETGTFLFFADPTSLTFDPALAFLLEWERRYGELGLRFLLVLRVPYPGLYDRAALQASLIKARDLAFPVALDPDGNLCRAFGAETLPKGILLHRGKTLFDRGGLDWMHDAETLIQQFLRQKDRGLPLLPIMTRQPLRREADSVEFGKGKYSGLRVEKILPDPLPANSVILTGNWKQDADSIITDDPKASIGFVPRGDSVSLIATPFKKVDFTAVVAVRVDGLPVFEEFWGPHVLSNDEGETVVKIQGGGIFHFVRKLPAKSRQVVCCFQNADRVPLRVFGLRIGE